jgi:hypothetical protein
VLSNRFIHNISRQSYAGITGGRVWAHFDFDTGQVTYAGECRLADARPHRRFLGDLSAPIANEKERGPVAQSAPGPRETEGDGTATYFLISNVTATEVPSPSVLIMISTFLVLEPSVALIMPLGDSPEASFAWDVMVNPADQRYELHHEAQDFTYCLTFPYEELDGRALDYVRETRIERIDTIKQQMDEHNRKLEEGYRKERDNQIECLAKDVHKFALRHEDDIQQKAFAETVKPKEVE